MPFTPNIEPGDIGFFGKNDQTNGVVGTVLREMTQAEYDHLGVDNPPWFWVLSGSTYSSIEGASFVFAKGSSLLAVIKAHADSDTIATLLPAQFGT